jgi:iron complex outermembrane receptor protein
MALGPRGHRKWWPAASIALSLLVQSGELWADARSEAKQHFQAGMEHIAAGRYADGVAELERAHELLPHPSVLYNIGKAWEDAGELEKAIAAYRKYIDTDPEDRGQVAGHVVELEKSIAESRAKPVEPETPKPGEAPRTKPRPRPKRPDRRAPTGGPDATGEIYEERVVTASRRVESPLDAPNSTSIITRQDIRLSGITRIPELLRRVAGIDVMQITGGDANVSMRGLNSRFSNKLLVLVNGRSVKNDILGSTFWESLSIDVDQIERIEVVRGPGSSLYGADAFSGVVNIITRAPGDGEPGVRAGYGDHNQAYLSAWATDRFGEFAYRGSAGYTRYPRWTREVSPERVDLHTTDVDQDLGAENLRADVRTDYRIDRDESLALGGGFARSTLDIYGIGPFNDYLLKIDTADASGGYRGKHVAVRSNYSYLGSQASSNADYLGHTLYLTEATQHAFETDIDAGHTFEWPEADTNLGLLGGVQYRIKSIDWNYLIERPPVEHQVGGFLQTSLGFLEHYSVVLSGRLDYVPAIENVVPSGRGSFIIRPGESKRQAIRASVATAFRSPTYLESYLDLPIQLALSGVELISGSERLDDPDFKLEPENILAGELGYVNQLSDLFQFEIAAYYHRISDLIVLADPRLLSLSDAGLGGINPETGRYTVAYGGWTNQCAVDHVFGGEAGGRFYGVEGLDIFANYAINYGLQELPDGCVVPQDQKTSRHKINVGTQLRAPFGLEGEITFHYQTAQVWGEQVATLDGIELQLFELDDYYILNGRVGYGFLEGRRANVSLVVFNALADAFGEPAQQHPFGNRIGRRVMGFFSYGL